MPSNSLTFAIRVRGEVNGIGFLGGGFKLADDFGLAGDDLVVGAEVVVLVHAEGFGRKIPDVANGSLHLKTASEKFLYGFDFGG